MRGSVEWLCKCDCGKSVLVASGNLNRGSTKSCGCIRSTNGKDDYESYLKEFLENDRKENTRLSTLNAKKSKANSSGHKGVTWDKSENKWAARIGFKGKTINLGRFEKIEDAVRARKAGEEKYFKPVLEKYRKETEPKH